jgi:hypothetical protein
VDNACYGIRKARTNLDTRTISYFQGHQVSIAHVCVRWRSTCVVESVSAQRCLLFPHLANTHQSRTLVPTTAPDFSTTSQHCTERSLRYQHDLLYSSSVRRALLDASLRLHHVPEASVLSQCNLPQSHTRIQKNSPLLTHYYSLPQSSPGSRSAKVFSITLEKSYSATSSTHSLHDKPQTQTRWPFTTLDP